MGLTKAAHLISRAKTGVLLLGIAFSLALAPACQQGQMTKSDSGTTVVASPPSCLSKGGTRLKLKTVSAGKARQVLSVVDTQPLGTSGPTDCDFVLWSDKKFYCLPKNKVLGQLLSKFSDCTQERFIPSIAVAPGIFRSLGFSYFRSVSSEGCGLRAALYSLIDQGTVATGSSKFYSLETGVCSPYDTLTDALEVSTGPAVDIHSFASATYVAVGTERIQKYAFQSDDGLNECETDAAAPGLLANPLPSYFDTSFKDTCEALMSEDGQTRCMLGFRKTPESVFTDNGCKSEATAILALHECLVPSKFVRVAKPGNACAASTVASFPLGERLATSYQLQNAQCAIGWQNGTYVLGPQTPSSQLALASFEVTKLEGRLGRFDRVMGENRTQLALYDTKLEVPCAFAQTPPDSKMRCLPVSVGTRTVASARTMYKDSVCTQAVMIGEVKRAQCFIPKFALAGTTVYPVGNASGGSLYEKDASGICGLVVSSASSFFQLGDAIAPTDFVEGTIQVE